MKRMKKYVAPMIWVYKVQMEACLTSTSVARSETAIEIEWTEETTDLGQIIINPL